MARFLSTLLLSAALVCGGEGALAQTGGQAGGQTGGQSGGEAAGPAPAPAQAAGRDVAAILQGAVEGFIRPAYRAFRDRAQGLADTMNALCEKPSNEALDAARDSFRKTVRAWGQAEIIRFGPITEENRLERILFFPDRRGLGLRQVQAALAAKDETAADVATLSAKSVAMQGLGALEYLVWGEGSEELTSADGSYRCRYARASAENVLAIARTVDTGWGDPKGFVARLATPSPDNPAYRTSDETLGELVGAFVDALEWVRDVRIKGFLGDKPESDKPKQALFWRSGMTLGVIGANLAGLSSLWEASGLQAALPADSAWIGQSIRFEFANANKAAADLDRPLNDTLSEPKARSRLNYLSVVTTSLSDIFGNRLSPTLALSTGFSSLDGD